MPASPAIHPELPAVTALVFALSRTVRLAAVGPRVGLLVASGLATGLAYLLRPSLLPFIVLLPIFLNTVARPLENLLGLSLPPGLMSNLELIVFGGLIIFFLIVEPHGLARLWQITKEKLRLWPFPH